MRLNIILHFGISFLVMRSKSNPDLNDEQNLFDPIPTEEDNDFEYFDYGNDTSNSTINGDQIMSEELWDYLTLEHDLENIDYENYDYSNLFTQESGSVYVNRSKFRWSSNEIPFQLDEQTFDEDYQERVENSIQLLNFKLDGCIEFRYVIQ